MVDPQNAGAPAAKSKAATGRPAKKGAAGGKDLKGKGLAEEVVALVAGPAITAAAGAVETGIGGIQLATASNTRARSTRQAASKQAAAGQAAAAVAIKRAKTGVSAEAAARKARGTGASAAKAGGVGRGRARQGSVGK